MKPKTRLTILLSLAAFGCMCLFSGCKQKDKTVWVGHPWVSDGDTKNLISGSLVHVEIGLRHDGVVVWRPVHPVEHPVR